MVAGNEISDPIIADNRAALRQFFSDFSNYLASPDAGFRPDKPLSDSAIDATQSQTQVFYTFMADNADEAALATGNNGWAALTDSHTRLWGPAFKGRRGKNQRELTWFSTSELQQMLCYLDVLAGDRAVPVAITHPDSTISLVDGLGDPQAARTWLLQALTGRRASEIHERRREITSLDAIIDRLNTDAAAGGDGRSISGAGTANRLPLLQIKTRGSHESLLRKADVRSAGPRDGSRSHSRCSVPLAPCRSWGWS